MRVSDGGGEYMENGENNLNLCIQHVKDVVYAECDVGAPLRGFKLRCTDRSQM